MAALTTELPPLRWVLYYFACHAPFGLSSGYSKNGLQKDSMQPDRWSLAITHRRGPGSQSRLPNRWTQAITQLRELCPYVSSAPPVFSILRLRLLRQSFSRPDRWIRAFARWYGDLDVPGLQSRMRAERIHCGTFVAACRDYCESRALLTGGQLADHCAHDLAKHLHDHLDSVFGMTTGKRSFGQALTNVGASRFLAIHPRRADGIELLTPRESEENLRLQLTADPKLRTGRVRSYARGVHPNPRLYKYSWQVFIAPPGGTIGNMKTWTWSMPILTHAEFRRQYEWLRENRIEFFISNRRVRRRHRIWDPDSWPDEYLAPSFDEDTDETAIDGFK